MAGRPIICVGDKTDHGGVVIEGSLFDTINGKAIARVGDKVTCPQRGHGGTTVIVTGDMTCMIDGKAIARHGDKTACGATLIASQSLTTDESGTAAATSASANRVPESEPPEAWRSDSIFSNDDHEPTAFDHNFAIHDKATGKPVSGFSYGLKAPAGELQGNVEEGRIIKTHSPSPHQVELTYLVQTEIGIRK